MYKDARFVAAQILSWIATVCAIWGGVTSLVLSVAAWAILTCAACCAVQRNVLNWVPPFAIVVALFNIVWSCVVWVNGSDVCNDQAWNEDDDKDCPWQAYATLLLVSATLWMMVAYLVYTFTHSDRFDQYTTTTGSSPPPPPHQSPSQDNKQDELETETHVP